MRWGRAYASAAAVAALAAGCSSSGHVTVASSPPAPSATVTRPGGLVGAIDAARVAAVCTNARAAQTVLAGGVGDASGKDALLAAAGLLERPPVDPTAASAAATIKADVRAGHTDAAITAALEFCRTHGG